MIAVLQRVTGASVAVDGKVVGACGHGLMILLGVDTEDTEKDAELLAAKIVKLRIFSDENGKMNLSVTDVGGDILVISQFTLLANYRHGNRPDFLASAPPERANALYEYFVGLIKNSGIKTETGIFGADMKVSLTNDGPVTIVMESSKLKNGEKK
ncbi:MAG: D-tyrosyl-tRNA(Tyr) deacylase [Clostridia bacterium]|nr:D-tyrosyl-tRNA(Tyr) deacylase [Clostridia bacterium]